MDYRIETTSVLGVPMEVFLFTPKGPGPHPGLVQCQHTPVGHTGVENDTVTLKTAERYCPEASEDAWRKGLAFFGEKLKRGL